MGDEGGGAPAAANLPTIPINKHTFNWDSCNLHEAFKLFRNQADFLLKTGQYGKCADMDKVGAFLNWLGPKSYGVYNDLEMDPGKSKEKYKDVVEAFEKYFKPTQSLFQSWYQLGGIYSSSFKSQTEFMLKLKEKAHDCSFTNADEIIKFLFLTHNQNSRVKDALLEKMKPTSTLTECLEYA